MVSETQEETKKPTEWRVMDHGADGASYFPGHGVAFTSYADCATGCGDTPKEAFEDALESLAQNGWDVSAIEADPDHQEIATSEANAHEGCEPGEPCSCDAGEGQEHTASCPWGQEGWHDGCEIHYYVSIDVK